MDRRARQFVALVALGSLAVPLAAFLGASAGVAGAYALGRTAGPGRTPAALILAGVPMSSLLTAIQTYVLQQHTATLQAVYSWILGRTDTSSWHLSPLHI